MDSIVLDGKSYVGSLIWASFWLVQNGGTKFLMGLIK